MAKLIVWLACLASWLLMLVFFVLRVLNVIQWAWFQVASPVIIFYAITCVLYALVCIAEAILNSWRWRKK